MSLPRSAVVLAAGKGKRMKSELPKVLHEIHGRPMIHVLLDTLQTVQFERIVVVVGYKGEMVEETLADRGVDIAWQHSQDGTGHAVQMAKPQLESFEGTTLVALGDVPFLSAASIDRLLGIHESTKAAATCLSAYVDDPTGYGRIVRQGDSDLLKEIVEHKDASDEIRQINEINTGTFCFDNQLMFKALAEVRNDNAQKEYYLPDAVSILGSQGHRVAVTAAENPDECLGVNSVEQLNLLASKFVKS